MCFSCAAGGDVKHDDPFSRAKPLARFLGIKVTGMVFLFMLNKSDDVNLWMYQFCYQSIIVIYIQDITIV